MLAVKKQALKIIVFLFRKFLTEIAHSMQINLLFVGEVSFFGLQQIVKLVSFRTYFIVSIRPIKH